MKNVEQITETLKSHETQIFEQLAQEDVDVYVFLCREYKKGNICDNNVFQFVYKKFYNMKQSDEVLKNYFVAMAQARPDMSNEQLMNMVFTATNRAEVSFATKLINIINNRKPILDKNAYTVIGETPKGTPEERKKEGIRIYNELDAIYGELVDCNKDLITEFRSRFKNTDEITDEKVLDFLIWKCGAIIWAGEPKERL